MPEPEELIHCIYTSRLAAGVDESELVVILDKARAKNARLGVTGMLLFESGSFFQVLEGPAGNVRELYETIGADPRHDAIVKLIEEPIEERDFGNWTMGIARLSRRELQSIPGLNDFFAGGKSLYQLDPGRAKDLLRGFRDGRWHQAVA